MIEDRLINFVDRISKQITLGHIVGLNLFFCIISIVYHQGGSLHPEMEVRLPYYLSNKPLLNILYDSRVLDLDFYRARELSYLLDYFDCKFLELTVLAGHPQFLSISHYLFTIIMGCLLWLFCVRELALDKIIGALVVSIFWTSPSIFLGGTIFRAGKIGVALLVSLLYYFIYCVVVASKAGNKLTIPIWMWLIYFIVLLSMSLLDEQGLFFNIVIILFILLFGVVLQVKNKNVMLLLGILSVAVDAIYRYCVSPQLTYWLNGYWPDFSYQKLPLQQFLHDPLYVVYGVYLYFETFSYLIGNPSYIIAVFIFILIVIITRSYIERETANDEFSKNVFFSLIVTNCLLPIVMNCLMVLRHPPIILTEVSVAYYFLPTNFILAMTLAIWIGHVANHELSKLILASLLLLVLAGNIISLPVNKATPSTLHSDDDTVPSTLLLEALSKLDQPSTTLPSVVQNSLVYRFFRERH